MLERDESMLVWCMPDVQREDKLGLRWSWFVLRQTPPTCYAMLRAFAVRGAAALVTFR